MGESEKLDPGSVALARVLCRKYHKGQFRNDKVTPYHTHPFAVADMVDTNDRKCIAYLHDIVEDTNCTVADLIQYGFNNNVISGVILITKEKNESIETYYYGMASHSDCVVVKLADMAHNMSQIPSEKSKARYLKGFTFLLANTNK